MQGPLLSGDATCKACGPRGQLEADEPQAAVPGPGLPGGAARRSPEPAPPCRDSRTLGLPRGVTGNGTASKARQAICWCDLRKQTQGACLEEQAAPVQNEPEDTWKEKAPGRQADLVPGRPHPPRSPLAWA